MNWNICPRACLQVCSVDSHQRGGREQRALRGSRQRTGRELPKHGEERKSKAAAERVEPMSVPKAWPAVSPCSQDRVTPTQGPLALGSGFWGGDKMKAICSFLDGSFDLGYVNDFSSIIFVSLGLKGPSSAHSLHFSLLHRWVCFSGALTSIRLSSCTHPSC